MTMPTRLRVGEGWDTHALVPGRRLVLVTAHRRESLGAPFLAICEAVAALANATMSRSSGRSIPIRR